MPEPGGRGPNKSGKGLGVLLGNASSSLNKILDANARASLYSNPFALCSQHNEARPPQSD